jgi:hypothetical protein
MPPGASLCFTGTELSGRLPAEAEGTPAETGADYRGGAEMKKTLLNLAVAATLTALAGVAMGCEYKAGETKFIDYAKCRYGDDAILVVDLPEGSSWDNCVYQLQAFRPPNLLAVTKTRDGKETHSINDRGSIGNPCYLTKQLCDKAMKAQNK